MKQCSSCGKKANSNKCCVKCGLALCYACADRTMVCKDCIVIADNERLVYDYFKDKYAETITI